MLEKRNLSSQNPLLTSIKEKKVTVGVIGLGYVGLPLAINFSKAQIKTYGFDTDLSKVSTLKQGSCYLKHLKEKKMADLVKTQTLIPTNHFENISQCQVIFLCLPTPLTVNLSPDLSFITQTCKKIAPHLSPNTLIILESTTWPGSTRELMQPILETHGPRRVGKDLYLAYSPERENPGSEHPSTETPKIVGGIDFMSLETASEVYSHIYTRIIKVKTTEVAEAAKLLENIFRSVNIALVNEMKIIFDKMGINVYDVIEAASTKTFGFMPFYPGPGLGGHCIPIDPYYFTWKAKEYGISSRFIELAGEINRAMPHWVVEKIQDCLNESLKSIKGSKILILGLSYKPNIDDIRESPALKILSLLKSKGAVIDYYDPWISKIPATRQSLELQGMESKKPSKNYDCFVMVTNHEAFNPEELLSYKVPIVDTRNHFKNTSQIFKA
jgi:UDP-N-acetyl-D-glucosamine dehydrogenase